MAAKVLNIFRPFSSIPLGEDKEQVHTKFLNAAPAPITLVLPLALASNLRSSKITRLDEGAARLRDVIRSYLALS
jgi:hypothetical protein